MEKKIGCFPQGATFQGGESDDFVLPLAPPPHPVGQDPIRNPGGNVSEPSSSTHAVGDGTPTEDAPPVVSEPVGNEDSSGSQEQTTPQIAETHGTSAPWSLVVILAFVIIGLLIAIGAKSTDSPTNTLSAPLPSVEDGRELASDGSETQSLRARAEQMSRKFEDSEQLLKTERLKYEALRREKKASEDKTGGLLAEVDSLKRQLQDYARRVPSADKPAQAVVPSAPNVGKLYRVAGLYADDSLNLRSGPGASKPIVIQLKNGVELFVVGSAVKNGPDVWLPCVIENAGSSSLKGWVNSNFVEPVPAQ